MNKQEFRKRYLDKRKSLSESACLQFNTNIYHLFFASIDLSFVRVIHLYLPMAKNNEPDTWQIIDRIRREFPQVRIAIPRINTGTSLIENFYFEGLHQIETNSWGIPEPKGGEPVSSSDIDMVLIPLLVFDEQGNRIGYGKGFYDRFLKDCRPQCKKIGLSFFDAVERITDVDDHDVPLDSCVTPEQVYTFKTSKKKVD